jgi:hypothetical protein
VRVSPWKRRFLARQRTGGAPSSDHNAKLKAKNTAPEVQAAPSDDVNLQTLVRAVDCIESSAAFWLFQHRPARPTDRAKLNYLGSLFSRICPIDSFLHPIFHTHRSRV